MAIITLLQQFISSYSAIITDIFVSYNALGRPILDFLHLFFFYTFKVILITAIGISILYYIMSAQVIFRRKNKKEEEPYTGEWPFVTIQIPTRNELAAIRCAKKCLEFDYPKNKYEILIGDDSDQPEVSRQLQEFADEHDSVRVIKRESNIGFKPGNLNNMLKYSNGEFLVLFDSDFVPKPDFLPRIIQPFMTDSKLAGVQSRWTVMNSNQNLVSALGTTIVSTCHHIGIPFLRQNTNMGFFCGSAEAVRKEVLEKLGGWESGALTEDIEFSMRLIKNGYRIEYLEELECESEVPYTLKDLYRQQMRWAYGVVTAYKMHFVDIAKSRFLSLNDKLNLAVLFCTGYFLSVLLAGLFITGVLAFVTHPPAPINIGLFVAETIKNVLLTSGLVVTSFVALARSKRLKLSIPMLVSSFTYGLVVTYYVNVGIFKALAKVPMHWFLLKKRGNVLGE